jgi:hypothetical protein
MMQKAQAFDSTWIWAQAIFNAPLSRKASQTTALNNI